MRLRTWPILVSTLACVAASRVAVAQDQPGFETLALVGGEVRPADGPVIPNGIVLVEDGKVRAVGRDVPVPAGARRIDCSGKVVTPGFIDADAALGLTGADRTGSRVTADLSAADAVDPWEPRFSTCLDNGVTGLHVTANSRDTLGGRAAFFVIGPSVATLLRGPESAFSREPLAFNLGTSVHSGGWWGGVRLAAVRGVLVAASNRKVVLDRRRRDLTAFEAARSLDRATEEERLLLPDALLARMRLWSPADRAKWREAAYKSMGRQDEYDKPKKPLAPPKPPRADAGLDVVVECLGAGSGDGRRVLLRTELAEDVAAAVDLRKEFDLDVVLLGGGGLLDHAAKLARLRIPVVVTHLADTAHRERGPLASRPEGLVADLAKAGLEPAISAGDASRGVRFLRLVAAREIGRGLSESDALRAVTLWAANAAGVGEILGSVTPGKRADLVIWSGDPFAAASRAERVIVGGRDLVR